MKDNVVLRYADSYRMMARTGTSTIDVWSIITDLERNMSPEVEEIIRENLALKKLLERAHERLDELKQPTYTGTGSDYLDCVLGVGGFESFGPITGDEK